MTKKAKQIYRKREKFGDNGYIIYKNVFFQIYYKLIFLIYKNQILFKIHLIAIILHTEGRSISFFGFVKWVNVGRLNGIITCK